MSKIVFFLLIIALLAMTFACSAPPSTNTNQANLPEGFSTNPVNTNGNAVPGINPQNINVAPNPNGTPTPGIPDPRNANVKPNPKGTPTPGIPSEKELKQMMNNSMRGNTNSGSVNSRQTMTDSDATPQSNTKKP